MARYDPKPYELKILELRGNIESKAKELQNVNEAVDFSRQEVKSLAERKSLLKGQVDKLEVQIVHTKQILQETIEKKMVFVREVAQAIKDEKVSLKGIKEVVEKTLVDLDNLNKVSVDIQEFIIKHSETRQQYAKEHDKLEKVKKEYQEVSPKLDNQKLEILQEKKELGEEQNYVSDLYGKLASYTKVAQKTLEYVNKHLEETGTPLIFQVPEITIDSFDKQ